MIEVVPNWHPIFVHFTLALWTVATGFFLLGIVWKKNRLRAQWLLVARWNLWLGALFALATAVAGWLAYNSVAHDAPSHAAMTEHRNWALATLAVMLPLSAWSGWRYRRGREPSRGKDDRSRRDGSHRPGCGRAVVLQESQDRNCRRRRRTRRRERLLIARRWDTSNPVRRGRIVRPRRLIERGTSQ